MSSHLKKQFLGMTWKWKYPPQQWNCTDPTMTTVSFVLWVYHCTSCPFCCCQRGYGRTSSPVSCMALHSCASCDVSSQHLHKHQCHEISTKGWRLKAAMISETLQKRSLGRFNKETSKVSVQFHVGLKSSRLQMYQPSWEIWVCVTINTHSYTELYSSSISKQNSTKTKNVQFTWFSF